MKPIKESAASESNVRRMRTTRKNSKLLLTAHKDENADDYEKFIVIPKNLKSIKI